jgi:hypothetical protein
VRKLSAHWPVHKTCHWFAAWQVKCVQCFQTVSSRSVLISSFCLQFIPRPRKWSHLIGVFNWTVVWTSRVPCARYKPCPSHPPWFGHLDVWWRVQWWSPLHNSLQFPVASRAQAFSAPCSQTLSVAIRYVWSHCCECGGGCLLCCYALHCGVGLPTFRRWLLPPSSGRWWSDLQIVFNGETESKELP